MTHAVETLARFDRFEEIAGMEFTPEAAATFRRACARAATADAATLDHWLNEMDAGTLSDGDMDPEVVWALGAIEARRDVLRSGRAETVAAVGISLLEAIDFQIGGAALDDFLANRRMQVEYDTILALLT
ncbi:MAG: hypothetical protein K0R81_767 [Microbacterium sp.]|nr:hypothetical protein [Microbacterium sp.]